MSSKDVVKIIFGIVFAIIATIIFFYLRFISPIKNPSKLTKTIMVLIVILMFVNFTLSIIFKDNNTISLIHILAALVTLIFSAVSVKEFFQKK